MIVIPMAGLSRRFSEAGYALPKFQLPIGGETVFDRAVGSFHRYFDDTPFLFIARSDDDAPAFIEARRQALGVRDARIVTLDRPTAGQAETVALGLDGAGAGDGPLTIFNIDTFRPGFAFPPEATAPGVAGYLEVFRGSGENWSYVRPQADGVGVAEVAEKRPISDLCCTGLYHFARSDDFRRALDAERRDPQYRELFVAPLYNHLLREGLALRFHVIGPEEVVFCGVPAEYEALTAGAVHP